LAISLGSRIWLNKFNNDLIEKWGLFLTATLIAIWIYCDGLMVVNIVCIILLFVSLLWAIIYRKVVRYQRHMNKKLLIGLLGGGVFVAALVLLYFSGDLTQLLTGPRPRTFLSRSVSLGASCQSQNPRICIQATGNLLAGAYSTTTTSRDRSVQTLVNDAARYYFCLNFQSEFSEESCITEVVYTSNLCDDLPLPPEEGSVVRNDPGKRYTYRPYEYECELSIGGGSEPDREQSRGRTGGGLRPSGR
jgi:hypothetical protein